MYHPPVKWLVCENESDFVERVIQDGEQAVKQL